MKVIVGGFAVFLLCVTLASANCVNGLCARPVQAAAGCAGSVQPIFSGRLRSWRPFARLRARRAAQRLGCAGSVYAAGCAGSAAAAGCAGSAAAGCAGSVTGAPE